MSEAALSKGAQIWLMRSQMVNKKELFANSVQRKLSTNGGILRLL